MSRRRNEVPTDRFNVSLPRPIADRVKTIAEARQLSGPATIASLVTSAVLGDVVYEKAEEERVRSSPLYLELVRQKDELAAKLTETHRELARLNRTTPAELRKTPRWAWPFDSLLADDSWWQTWLPRLYQLLGGEAPGRGEASEDTGYVDLLGYLYPPIGTTTWGSPEYRTLALATAPAPGHGLQPGPGRARSWEPVIRHVALALAALETTEDPDADAYHAMRVHAEITGPWASTLRHLLGRSPAELNDLPLWTGR